MNYSTPLIEGQFIKRYKRFFADILLDGKTVVAHVPNTGSLKGVCDQSYPCRVSDSKNPDRKLKFTLEQIKTPHSWVGVNTHLTNSLVWEAWTEKQIPHWIDFVDGRKEVKIDNETRLDLAFTKKNGLMHFVEVKSVSLASPPLALFPDAVTTRGHKHLSVLKKLAEDGHTSEIVFVIQRTDCRQFSPADEIDIEYGKLLREVRKKVQISVYPVSLDTNRISLNTKENIQLRF